MTRYTEGFSHFVTSMTAPVASGWSVRRVGLAPTGKRRLSRRTQEAGIHCRLSERVIWGPFLKATTGVNLSVHRTQVLKSGFTCQL